MRSDGSGRALFLAAAIAAGMPIPAGATNSIVWIDLCDARHPGRKTPLPLDRDDRPAAQGCHAACGPLPDRRGPERGKG